MSFFIATGGNTLAAENLILFEGVRETIWLLETEVFVSFLFRKYYNEQIELIF